MKSPMSPKDIANYSTLSTSTVYKEIAANNIPSARVGTRIVCDRPEVERWLEDRRTSQQMNSMEYVPAIGVIGGDLVFDLAYR